MTLFSKPLVCLSLTDPDRGLLQYAANLTRLFGWREVHLLYVVPPDHRNAQDWNPLPWQEKMRASAAGLFGDAGLIFHVTRGSRLDGIMETLKDQTLDLIILGHRRSRSGRRSLASRTALIAPASIWLVPEGATPDVSNILVPTDFSDHSADALSAAVAVARAARLAKLQALHVYFDPSTVRFDEHLDEVLGKEAKQFQQHLAGIDAQGIGIDALYHESIRPSQAILRVAEKQNSNLIVMNTRGRSQAAYVLLGSTTAETLATTQVPLLAIKHYGGRLSLLQALRNPELWKKKDMKTN